jgi:hypothetical protein
MAVSSLLHLSHVVVVGGWLLILVVIVVVIVVVRGGCLSLHNRSWGGLYMSGFFFWRGRRPSDVAPSPCLSRQVF